MVWNIFCVLIGAYRHHIHWLGTRRVSDARRFGNQMFWIVSKGHSHYKPIAESFISSTEACGKNHTAYLPNDNEHLWKTLAPRDTRNSQIKQCVPRCSKIVKRTRLDWSDHHTISVFAHLIVVFPCIFMKQVFQYKSCPSSKVAKGVVVIWILAGTVSIYRSAAFHFFEQYVPRCLLVGISGCQKCQQIVLCIINCLIIL